MHLLRNCLWYIKNVVCQDGQPCESQLSKQLVSLSDSVCLSAAWYFQQKQFYI